VVQSLDAAGKVQPYTAGGTFKVLISYQLPDDSHLKVGGKSFVYTATLHAAEVGGGTTRCGNASWTFTHDGKNLGTAGGGTSGENSFFGFPPEPLSGQVATGQELKVFYVDESPMQKDDTTANAFGVDFNYTNSAGTTSVQIPPSTHTGIVSSVSTTASVPNSDDGVGYWFTNSDSAHSKDKYNTTIHWTVASSLNTADYTIFLKAFDTDQNANVGNDCGIVTWTLHVTGLPGSINLIE
jgi:hypothetical protein